MLSSLRETIERSMAQCQGEEIPHLGEGAVLGGIFSKERFLSDGTSAVDNVSYLLSMALPARNLALVEKTGTSLDFLNPCSACYLNFQKLEDHIGREDHFPGKINLGHSRRVPLMCGCQLISSLSHWNPGLRFLAEDAMVACNLRDRKYAHRAEMRGIATQSEEDIA